MLRHISTVLLVCVLTIATASLAADPAQDLGLGLPGEPVTVSGYASLNRVTAGGTIHVAVVLQTSGHWHVNAHRVNDEFLIPTTLELSAPEGLAVTSIVYPDGIEKTLGFSETPMRLYAGQAAMGAVIAVDETVEPGEYAVQAAVTYQPCDNEKCLAPTTETLSIPIEVAGPTALIDATHPEIFGQIDFSASTGDAGGAALSAGAGRLGAVISQQGYFYAFVIVFLWGLALNLTPCVYPMIPITVSYFGGQSAGRMSYSVVLASIYVLGMAVMYSALGLFAALTGSLFGTALQNPWVLIFIALVMVTLSLSMFGLYEIRPPARLTSLFGQSSSKQGPVGAFLMGLTVGIVAAPCIGPFVIALLTFVGQNQSPVLGFSLFFVLALGLGAPFLVLAMLSGNISRLPKSGEWMDWVKMLFGLVLIDMAIYFLEPLIHDVAYYLMLGTLCIAGGIFLGFIKKTQTKSIFFRSFKRFVGIAGPALGLYLILNPGHIIARDAPEGGIAWSDYDATLLQQAKSNSQYVLIDFSADWCIPCKELDHLTFSKKEVVDSTAGFVTLRADLTESGSETVVKLREKFEIQGVPTVVFIDKNGRERKDLRVLGFVDKDEFLQRIERLKGREVSVLN